MTVAPDVPNPPESESEGVWAVALTAGAAIDPMKAMILHTAVQITFFFPTI
jgi:hypothetical protein